MKKCIVFDFDCTITYYHCFNVMRGTYDSDNGCNINNIIKYLYTDSKKLYRSIPNIHISNKDFGNPIYLCNIIMGGTKRINNIKQFFKKLLDHGVILVIASFGYVDEICNILKTVGINPNIFKYIFGRTLTYPAIRGTNGKLSYIKTHKIDKVKFIKCLHHSSDTKLENGIGNIVYIDDSPGFNYFDSFIMENIKTIKLKSDNGGMNEYHMNQILELMNIDNKYN